MCKVVSIFLFKDVLQFNDDMEHVNEIIKCQNPVKPPPHSNLFSVDSKVWKGTRIHGQSDIGGHILIIVFLESKKVIAKRSKRSIIIILILK